jgi:hypothetical protein
MPSHAGKAANTATEANAMIRGGRDSGDGRRRVKGMTPDFKINTSQNSSYAGIGEREG